MIRGESHSWMMRIQMVWKTRHAMRNSVSPHTKSGVPDGAGKNTTLLPSSTTLEVYLYEEGESVIFTCTTSALVSSVCITVSYSHFPFLYFFFLFFFFCFTQPVLLSPRVLLCCGSTWQRHDRDMTLVSTQQHHPVDRYWRTRFGCVSGNTP